MRFGFGDLTGIDIYEESKANMPTREWKMARHKVPWYQGDTIPVGIGQGYWTATPMQIAKATSVLVNHGKVIAPHLLRATIDNGEQFSTQKETEYTTYPPIDGVPKSIGTWLSMACIWLTMVLKEPHVAPSRICLTKVRVNQGQRKYLV